MSGRMSQRKGAAGELEVQTMFRTRGFDCTRGFASGASGGGDLAGDLPDHVEVKRTEQVRLHMWIAQVGEAIASGAAGGIATALTNWVIFHRRSRSKWVAIVDAERYLDLIELERNVQREREKVNEFKRGVL